MNSCKDVITDKQQNPSGPVTQGNWRQFRGDPSIRGKLFEQQRALSMMDQYMDETMHFVNLLMQHHGIFHAKLHFSSSRMTFWYIEDPFNYRLHDVAECLNADIFIAYPEQTYPEKNSQNE